MEERTEYEQHQARVAARQATLKAALVETLPSEGELTLEIGCGHGHWLTDYAASQPEKTCVGIDIIGDRVERANKKRFRANLENVFFVKGEAFETLDLMPPALRLAEVFILFPDPWPKKRHWKNRLFCEAFLRELASRCQAGVRCYFRTDHGGYFEWAEEVLGDHAAGLWERDTEAAWPFERETVFQARADSYQSLILKRTAAVIPLH